MGIGGLGIGDWGLGIGDWAQSPIPNPQSPIPQSPLINIFNFKVYTKHHKIKNKIFIYKNINKNKKC
jgi:hypothetical protein